MILFIIFGCFIMLDTLLLILSICIDWNNWVFGILCALLVISGFGMIICAAFINPGAKAIEYPSSEYTFKIKVVEFEEHRDTILVVIPKEE